MIAGWRNLNNLLRRCTRICKHLTNVIRVGRATTLQNKDLKFIAIAQKKALGFLSASKC